MAREKGQHEMKESTDYSETEGAIMTVVQRRKKAVARKWCNAVSVRSHGSKCLSNRLENIEENIPANWLLRTCPPPETPTESMEFLARSWSLSVMELSKALSHTHTPTVHGQTSPLSTVVDHPNKTQPGESQLQPLPKVDSPPVSPRGSDDTKELFLLHEALNADFLTTQQLLNNGLYRTIIRGKTTCRWIKDQKEKKKQKLRTHNAQLHAAVSVAGVAAAVAALAASLATLPEKLASQNRTLSKTSCAMASAATLVASHCIEIAEDMGADHEQILTVVNSAINARTNGDIMTLTAGAATALRGAATLRARLQKGFGAAAITLADEYIEQVNDSNVPMAANFVSKGGELLKRTRKGDLHWKQVSFNINSNWQVVAKMKSKHMAGTFTKKKKCVVSEVYCDIPAWPGREIDEGDEFRAYFGIKTTERIIEFQCRNKGDKQMWVKGIKQMLNCCVNMPTA